MKRGQATAEFAVIIPLVAMMLAVTIQLGMLISDQLNINQAVNDAAEWAVANRSIATVDAGGPGTIAQHAYNYLCGASAPPAPVGTGHKYCESRSGLPNLSVAVTSVQPTALGGGGRWQGPIVDARAANGCKDWRLTLRPQNPAPITAGSSQTYTITLTVLSGQDDDPVVTLYGGGYPSALQNGHPLFNPPTVQGGGGNTSSLTIGTSAQTPPGTYTIRISGQDQCGSGPKGGDSSVTLVVQGPVVQPSPSPSPSGVTVSGIAPNQVCPGVATSVTVTGTGFQSGAAAQVGGVALTGVSVTSSTQLTGTVPALTSGMYNVTVTNPGGAAGILNNALTVQASCGTPSPSPTAASGVSCPAGPGSYETVITIAWAEPVIFPVLVGSGPAYITVRAVQVAFCT